MKKLIFSFTVAIIFNINLYSQLIPDPSINKELISKQWPASWIKVPASSAYDYGVYFFKNSIDIKIAPDEFIIHVSADNRYKLYVNGQWIGLGPARGDADNWIFESYNIAPFLKPGKNTIASVVWNFGEHKPYAQISLFTGFIVQGDDINSSVLNTPGSWKCKITEAYEPFLIDNTMIRSFYVVGPGDKLDANLYPWDWLHNNPSDSLWESPTSIYRGTPKGVGTEIRHALIPRKIPAMELQKTSAPVVRKINNQIRSLDETPKLKDQIIPSNSEYTILLDQKTMVTAYPEFMFSGGKNAKVKISYAESMFEEDGTKPHRDSVRNLLFKGNSDLYISDGGENRVFSTLWFRTFRYILLKIETKEEPLVIHQITPVFTGYPFKEKAFFKSSDPTLNQIWETAWRTCRLCANELYYDCPYYEQLQYIGDTRIQALISLYISGDDRLMRKAITDFYNSLNPDGLTLSRYPTEPRQIIPTYSLFWISMIHDFLMHRNDFMFPAGYLTSIQHIIKWFEDRIDPQTGMMGPLEYWPFVDWADGWRIGENEKSSGMPGVPAGGKTGNSSVISFQFAWTLKQAADIFNFYGLKKISNDYLKLAESIIDSTNYHCWDKQKEMYADTPEKSTFSQHANTFALLANAIPKNEKALFFEKIYRDSSLINASLYFKYYLNRASIEAGLDNKYLNMLEPWKNMLKSGLTTFAEIPNAKETRSDCHGWSASPIYELLATVAGISPGSAGFETVIIKPNPGDLEWIKAGIPHPLGEIELDLSFDIQKGTKGTITLPDGLTGIFVWDHQTIDLKPGKQRVSVENLNNKYKIR